MVMEFCWKVGYTNQPDVLPKEMVPAKVPGSAQLDYAQAKQMPSYLQDDHYKLYTWMEDVYWIYQTTLNFSLSDHQIATLVLSGVDYQCAVRVDGEVIAENEGMFTPIVCDVSKYAGGPHNLEVVIYPAPKADESGTRSQASRCCKPAACYGWDWHPRLITCGLYDRACLKIQNVRSITHLDAEYTLSETLTQCRLSAKVGVRADSTVCVRLMDGEKTVCAETRFCQKGDNEFQFSVDAPKLWHPIGYGAQSMYTLHAHTVCENETVGDECTRKIGFRRSKLVMNEGSWDGPDGFPKSRSDSPATLELNGRRIFAKGSNWVNAHVAPGAVTDEDYQALLKLVRDANMNILRIWGGGFVNHESFYDLCDEMGIMVWQEFPLACNEYPDDDRYLSVLEQEATSIIRRLRTHPCLVMWCGGNELFNNWSGMTEQHHALRLLDKICYTEDRSTPFIMTSPLNGMAHGHYCNYDENIGEEFITSLVRSHNTAYTEFGCPGASDPEYIRQYISKENYADCTESNGAWTAHHAFGVWYIEAWLRRPEVNYFFGGFSDTDDLCKKMRFLQTMCYRSYFEEMRKQWPHCAMALNWCFNEPWPTVANNSLLSWPAIPKPCYYAVQSALRPQLVSLRIDRHLWWAGERFHGEVWGLNDSLQAMEKATVKVSYCIGDGAVTQWGVLHMPSVAPQSNCLCGTVSFPIPQGFTGKIYLKLSVEDHPEMDSEYTYLCRAKTKETTAGMLNV